MKTLLSILILSFSLTLTAQVSDGTLISGKITVPVGEDPEGISIVNRSAMNAAVSNDAGLFQIRAAKGDTIHFSALQFQDFSVVLDQGVIDNRQLNVFVSEAVNELPEVVVMPYDLSGNVRVDVQIIPVVETDLPTQSAAEINPYNREFRPDSLVSPQSAAMREGMIYSGANLANIFRHIFSPRDVVNDLERERDLQEQILLLKDDDFFEEELNIEENNIREFIFFAQDNGLTPEMLQPESELQLLEFLIAQAQEYKQRKAGN